MTIGFLGAGNMASAIMRGMVESGFDADAIVCFDIDTQKTFALQTECGVGVCDSAEQLCRVADTVILCIKPQVFPSALPALKDALSTHRPLVISIAAGKTIDSIAALIGNDLPVVRVMPNVAATVGEAVTAYCSNPLVTSAHIETVYTVFEAVGTVLPIDEAHFDVFTVLASCSPAYTLLYMDALATAGVKAGLPKATALDIVAQSVLGTAKLLQQSGRHPRELADSVCSPGGTTIAGVCALQAGGFEKTVIEAADASLEKDKKLQNA